MKTIALSVAACAAFLLLAGCSSESSDASSGENAESCTAFATSHNAFVATVEAVPTDQAGVEKWTADKSASLNEFTTQSEQATGEVKNALTTLVADLPADSLELSEPDSESGQQFVDNSNAVASACEADGTSITLDEFPLLKF
ncbi:MULTISPECIES: hypothetical protein [Rhodococcus]|uniref:Lipoprotein n=1 Tax=Rhodococcus cercidiphylli TaxID=489916 RepID=A0ABU4AVD6_9NOCA|nr:MULTISPECIES: hypothetical protein [Rhodococcus]MDV6230187.1 hypothetical protein [Rhodococcus cercidiphylli]MDV7988671.1 hypothetical protein [Rhodococcus sp. IEGM 1374]